jgi:hypothetical protein
MRSTVIYFDRKLTPRENTLRILAIRDELFPRTLVSRRNLRWVPTSSTGGYWTNES